MESLWLRESVGLSITSLVYTERSRRTRDTGRFGLDYETSIIPDVGNIGYLRVARLCQDIYADGLLWGSN